MYSDISIVITSVGRPRHPMLRRAIDSAMRQTLEADAIIVSVDTERRGAAQCRQNGLEMVRTPFVAWLDDDDELNPEHLEVLKAEMIRTKADVVYPWFDVIGGSDPFPMHEGKPWNNDEPIQFPITYLARTEGISTAGGWVEVEEGEFHPDGNRAGEDWRLELNLVKIGAKIVHLPQRTWKWHHDTTGGNSSGLPGRINWI